jgi:hypothetical protein
MTYWDCLHFQYLEAETNTFTFCADYDAGNIDCETLLSILYNVGYQILLKLKPNSLFQLVYYISCVMGFFCGQIQHPIYHKANKQRKKWLIWAPDRSDIKGSKGEDTTIKIRKWMVVENKTHPANRAKEQFKRLVVWGYLTVLNEPKQRRLSPFSN